MGTSNLNGHRCHKYLENKIKIMDTIEAVLPRALQMSEIEMELKSHGNKKTTNMATDRKTAHQEIAL